MSKSNPINYRPDIDGIRAIAVLLVLAVHASPKKFPNGYVGVDVFFVISGYLITLILLREIATDRFSIKEFYVRRVNRIFPALLLVLASVMAAGPFLMYSNEYIQMSKSAWASALFSANVLFYLEAGYWDISSKLKPLLHLWSLGVEEQFYLIWPLILLICIRKKIQLLTAILAVIFMSLVINLAWTPHDQPGAFYLPIGRFWELAAGGLLAGLQQSWQSSKGDLSSGRSNNIKNVMSLGGILLLAVTQATPMNEKSFPGYYALIIVIATALLIFAGPHAWLNRNVLAHPIAVYIGKISYPLYLWHWPLLVFARLLGDGQWTAAHRNVAVISAVILAILTHHLVEKPLSLRVVQRGRLAAILAACMTGMGLFAAAIHTGKWSLSAAPYANAPLASYGQPEIHSHGKVVLLGDSNAGHMEYGLSLLYGQRLKTYVTPGWPYLDGVKYREGYIPSPGHNGSPEITQAALKEIEMDPEVKLVIFSNAYMMYLPGDNLRSISGGAAPETVAQVYEDGTHRTIQRLQASGKKVVFVKSIPIYPMMATVMACAEEFRPLLRDRPKDCVRPRAIVQSERMEYDGIVSRAVAGLSGVNVFDTLPVLCDAQYCYVNRDGIQMYIDSGHYTTAGSQLMGAAIARQIEQFLAR